MSFDLHIISKNKERSSQHKYSLERLLFKMSSTKNIAQDPIDYYDYEDDFSGYDEVYLTSNKGGGGGRRKKSGNKGELNVYSSKHTRLQLERKSVVMPIVSKRKKGRGRRMEI